MKRMLRMIALVAVLGLVAAACGDDGDTGDDTTNSEAPSGDLSGGTLRMAQLADVVSAFDPQKEYYSVTWEYYRCCLLRTLMSYEGVPTDQGGAEIHPDLAAAEPTVSEDGLTWTFTIKPGINYAPPFEDVTITANDFVTAIKRTANPKANVGGYSFYYSVIEGFDDYANGDADDISGITAVDDTTLEINLTEPTGDLGYRFAMATTAPIPPNGDAELGAAEGHDKDYGRYLVASGPYMFRGSETLDFSLADQGPEPGWRATCPDGPSNWCGTRRGARRPTTSDRPTPTRSSSRSAATTTTCTTRCRPARSTSWSTAPCRRTRSRSTRPPRICRIA